MEATLSQKENDLKKLRLELQSSRHSEQDSRSQLHTVAKSLKSELHQLKNDNEIYQQK